MAERQALDTEDNETPRKHEITKQTLQDDSFQAIWQNRGVEVHQQAETQSGESQIAHDLRVMDGSEALDGLDLDEHLAAYNYVDPLMTQQLTAIGNRNLSLDFERKSVCRQFDAHGTVIDAFEQARAELAMDRYAATDDSGDKRLKFVVEGRGNPEHEIPFVCSCFRGCSFELKGLSPDSQGPSRERSDVH